MHEVVSRLELLTHRLGDFADQVIFLGGAVVPLWLTDEHASDARSTDDLDAVIEAASRIHYDLAQIELRKLGFDHDTRQGAPVCRFVAEDLIFDLMPHPDHGMGYNSWYEHGIRAAVAWRLPSGRSIRIFSPAHLFATKIAAFEDRGAREPLVSDDMADLIALLDGCDSLLSDMTLAETDLRAAVANWARWLLTTSDLNDIVDGHISRVAGRGREHVLVVLRALTTLTPPATPPG